MNSSEDIYCSHLKPMQKLINLMAFSSFLVSASIVAGGTYVYLEKDSITESVKENITKEIQGMVSESLVNGLNSGVPEIPGVESGGTSIPSIPF